MTTVSEKALFDALATVSRAFTEAATATSASGDAADADGPAELVNSVQPEVRAALGEAALAVAYGAFASQDQEAGVMHMLVGAIGLLAMQAGEDPDPPAEIMAVLAEDDRVESEIDRAGEALDQEFGRDAPGGKLAAALEARIVGSAITLAGCTLPERLDGQAAVRAQAARILARLAAGLMTINAAEKHGALAPQSQEQ
jgi:hypothetical protein